MELREYWSIIRRRWWLPVAITLVALIAATAVGVRGAAAYKTDMRIAISTIPTPDPNATLYYDPTYYSNLDSEYLADDMSEFMTSRGFADEVTRELATANQQPGVDVATIMSATRTKKTHRFIDVTITTSTFEEGQAIGAALCTHPRGPNHLAPALPPLPSNKTPTDPGSPPGIPRPH